MRKISDTFENICVKAVLFLGIGIFGLFAYWAAIFTHEFPYDYSEERIMGWFDSVPWNLTVAVVVLFLLYLVKKLFLRGTPEQQKKRMWKLTIADLILVGIGLSVWVTVAHVNPFADQMQVYLTALEFKNGDYHNMLEYMCMYPHQYGLAFLYEGILNFWQSYRLIQYCNILFALLILFFSCRITEELFHNQGVNLYCLIGMTAFLPLFFYVNFVYGEMCSVAMGLIGIWAVMRWCDTKRTHYACICLACMTLGVLARKNTMVILLALFLTLLIFAVKSRRWQSVLLALLLLVIPLGSIEVVKLSYEKRSGIEIAKGIPEVMWIAMGMQENWNGAGVYNGYNNSIFWSVEGDSEAAAAIGIDYIRVRAKEFSDNPRQACEFYRYKLLEQWNEQTFGSMISTSCFDKEPEGVVKNIYYGDLQNGILIYMNRYIFIFYLCILFYGIGALAGKNGILQVAMMIAVIGGVLFSLLWEAKGRYVFPYVVLLFPYMAGGIEIVQSGMEKLMKSAVRRNAGFHSVKE